MTKIPVETKPRLTRFRIDHPVLGIAPPLHSMGVIKCDEPHPLLDGWSLEIRGAAAFLISPRGWMLGKTARELTGKGPITVVGPIPMLHVLCAWEGEDQTLIDKLQRFTSPPFERVAPTVPEEQGVDSKDLGDA